MSTRLWLVCLLALVAPAAGHAQGPAASPGGAAPPVVVDPVLAQRAQAEGTVRVIVELAGMPIVPETSLSDEVAVAAQRQRIAGGQSSLRQTLRGLGHRVRREFRTLPLLALEVSPESLRRLESLRGVVATVHEDTLVEPALTQSGPLVGALATGSAGLDGRGTVIAIVDTGVDRHHPFLQGRVVDEACFSTITTGTTGGFATTCPNGLEEQVGPGASAPCAATGCHHGTLVAGIAAGSLGVARGAGIISVQVFSQGTTAAVCAGLAPPCVLAFTSDILAGLEYVYLQRGAHNLAAVNLSLGGGRFFAPCDGHSTKGLIDVLREAGIATVAASGNSGFSDSMSAPACVSTAVSVASTTKADVLSTFSNVPPFLSLLAPGEAVSSSIPGGAFAAASGTSLAAPHVAGAFAILRQVIPGATVSQMLEALRDTGRSVVDAAEIGRPRIQVDAALAALGAGPLPPAAVVTASASTLRPGQPVSLWLTAVNPMGNPPLDLYVGSLWPDGDTIAWLSEPNALALGQLSAPASIRPFATIEAGFAVLDLPILTFAFPARGLPAGTYHVFAALRRPDVVTEGKAEEGTLVGLTHSPVTFSP
jgi:subtilisin family serine protease